MGRKIIKILSAEYVDEYRIAVIFNDGKKVNLNFEPFLFERNRGYYDKYRGLKHFKKFRIQNGNLVWGKDRDLVFEVYDLYSGKFSDKKVLA